MEKEQRQVNNVLFVCLGAELVWKIQGPRTLWKLSCGSSSLPSRRKQHKIPIKEQPSQLLTASLLCLPRGVNRFKGHLLLISHFSPLGPLSVEVPGIKMRQLPSQSEKNQKSPYTPYRAFQNPLGLNTANHLIMFGSPCNIDGS